MSAVEEALVGRPPELVEDPVPQGHREDRRDHEGGGGAVGGTWLRRGERGLRDHHEQVLQCSKRAEDKEERKTNPTGFSTFPPFTLPH